MDRSDELRMKFQIERLGRISVTNLATVMRLVNAIEAMPNAPKTVLDSARQSIDEQIQLLQELYGMEGENGKK